MNFGFSEEQELLRQEVRKFLDERAPLETVREIMKSEAGFSPDLWKETAELGWPGLTIPESHGGAGLGWVDLVVLLEETGRTLLPSPLVSTTLAASALIESGSEAQKQRWLPGLADGTCIGTPALLEDSDVLGPAGIALHGRPEGADVVLSGTKRFIADAGIATLFLVPFRSGDGEEEISLALVEADARGVTAGGLRCMDETKRLGTLVLDDVRVPREALLGEPQRAWPNVARLLDRGSVAITAEMIGAAEAALTATAQYAKDRIQFGEKIGKFQGVKHPLAEMYVDVESFKSLLYYAAWALDESPDEVPRAASLAKAYASDALARIGIDGVQIHGAVGYAEEYDIQLYLKRSKWARGMYGDADYHYERVAALGGL
jgi:alkylation response protein AidB-like acyl-CoA dehydrogenase